MKKSITIIKCDWCKMQVKKAITLDINGAIFDVCEYCSSRIFDQLSETTVEEEEVTE